MTMKEVFSGWRAVAIGSLKVLVVYLAFVLFLICIEVFTENSSIAKWPYLLSSGLYVLGGFYVCLAGFENRFVALGAAIASTPIGLLTGAVAGVNFKFLIGGGI